MIYPCSCKSEYQDLKYGKGNRVYNHTKNGGRCTICKNEVRGQIDSLKVETKNDNRN